VGFLTVLCFSSQDGFAWSINQHILTEDFTDSSHWDASGSTGFWNMVDHAIQAGRVTGGVASQKLSLGDGSDGILDTSNGYTFDTDAHPNGFNFILLRINGGAVQVQGSFPLVIRSLSSVTITPLLSVKGAIGQSGIVNGSISVISLGGTAIAGKCSGGAGGNASGGSGESGLTYEGLNDYAPGSLPAGGSGVTAGTDAGTALDVALSDQWETNPSHFRCGAGGSGGGGQINGGNHTTGGAGGAGGGSIRISAAGPISVGQVSAEGADGGLGANNSGTCSGGGGGGNGGIIWLQSLQTVTSTSLSAVAGRSASCAGYFSVNFDGFSRTDSKTASDRGAFSTGSVAPLQTYEVLSKPYDLETQNAGFLKQPTILTTLNGGTIKVQYEGSSNSNGSEFSSSTEDITTLSDKKYRYIRFRIIITTGSSTGISPELNSISIPFEELDVRLKGGCGSLQVTGSSPFNHQGMKLEAMWILCFIFIFIIQKQNKGQKNTLLRSSRSKYS
jgi:hypothetical protein